MKTKTGAHIFPLKKHEDDRGWLIELFRSDQLNDFPEMAYVSETKPGVTRGPHEHVEQTDHFAFVGPGNFHLHLWEEYSRYRNEFHYEILEVGEDNPSLVIVPPGVVHAYKNVSKYPGWVFNAPDALYAGRGKLYEVDEIRHEDSPDGYSKYRLYDTADWIVDFDPDEKKADASE